MSGGVPSGTEYRKDGAGRSERDNTVCGFHACAGSLTAWGGSPSCFFFLSFFFCCFCA